MNSVGTYVDELRGFRARLFSLYSRVGAEVGENRRPEGFGWTCGYKLDRYLDVVGPNDITGTSIGADEIKLFFDLGALIDLRSSLVIGNAFGLSTFCLAMASRNEVAAIDNWSQGRFGAVARELCERIIDLHGIPNVRLHTGSSPGDVPAALARLPVPLSLVFIDGWHSNEQVELDFLAVRPFLDRRSIVLFHDCRLVYEGFKRVYRDHAASLFAQQCVLHTYGQMGVYYNSTEHPAFDAYLRETNLVWTDFEQFFPIVRQTARLMRVLRNERFLTYRAMRRLCRYTVPWIQL